MLPEEHCVLLANQDLLSHISYSSEGAVLTETVKQVC